MLQCYSIATMHQNMHSRFQSLDLLTNNCGQECSQRWTCHRISVLFCRPSLFKRLPTKLVWLLKLALYFSTMLSLMIAATVRAGRPNLMLIQSPPANPTLAVCALIRYLYGTATIIDFHNIAYTLMRTSPAPGQDKSLLYADDPLAVRSIPRNLRYPSNQKACETSKYAW